MQRQPTMSNSALPQPNTQEPRDRLLLAIGSIVILAVLLVMGCSSLMVVRWTTPVNASGPEVLLPPFANYEAWNGTAPFPIGQEAIRSKISDQPANPNLVAAETPIPIGIVDLLPTATPTGRPTPANEAIVTSTTTTTPTPTKDEGIPIGSATAATTEPTIELTAEPSSTPRVNQARRLVRARQP